MPQIFAAVMIVDDCGTKNCYQNSLSLWQLQNWKPFKILGREIDSETVGSPTQAKIYGAPSTYGRLLGSSWWSELLQNTIDAIIAMVSLTCGGSKIVYDEVS